MHRKWIALLCCACLLLSGCQMLALLDQVREEASPPGRESMEEMSSAQQSAREMPSESSALRPQPGPGLSEPAQPHIAEDIIQNAGPDDLMAVLQNPDSEAYRSLGGAKASIDDFGFGDGAGHETILIVPLGENVRITVEQVWLDYSLNFMYLADTLGEFSGKPGEHLALNTFFPEGIPHVRVVAQLGEQYAVWYCQYDGMGAEDVEYISANVPPEPIREDSAGINMLSVAAAVSAIIFAEEYEEMTSEELGKIPDAYWQTVTHALTMYQESSDGDFDAYSGEPMRIPDWLARATRQALFPGLSMPPDPPYVSYEFEEDAWHIEPCAYGDFAYWEHISSESSGDGKTGSVVIAVTCPDSSPHPVTYRVEWAANDKTDIYMPFQYHMTGVSVLG